MEKWKHRERVVAREQRRMYDGEGEWVFDHTGMLEIVHPQHSATTMERPPKGAMAHMRYCVINCKIDTTESERGAFTTPHTATLAASRAVAGFFSATHSHGREDQVATTAG